MNGSNRRGFLTKGMAAGAGAVAVPASAQEKASKRVLWKDGKRLEKTPLFSSTVAYGNLLFIAGVGAHFEGILRRTRNTKPLPGARTDDTTNSVLPR